MTERQKVKLLVVVWGDRYVKEFSRIALPALLAPGNLPVLAEDTDFEVLIMTQRKSEQFFHQEAAYCVLKKICRVRFIFIDDLIDGANFGVTLTLAYARGVRDSGDAQTSTYFIFLNADFIVADGSLRTLREKMKEGCAVVFAPSLRARSENVAPLLEQAVDSETQILALPPRDMVRLALENLHPTVIAKTITQGVVKCDEYNHLYWQVDKSTLLARNYLIFIPIIRPETPMPPVNSYSDYGFVPELVPTGRVSYLRDSDEFFMLELQRTRQEGYRISCGRPVPQQIADELSYWTTSEHRLVAEHDFVFHAAELPAQLPFVRAQASAYMEQLKKLMNPLPVHHAAHPYWAAGLNAWLTFRPKKQWDVPELAVVHQTEAAAATVSTSFIDRLRRSFGTASRVSIWRHHWLDIRLALNWIDSLAARPRPRNLLLFSEGSVLALYPELKSFDRLAIEALIGDDRCDRPQKTRYSNVLCHVSSAHAGHVRGMLKCISPCLEQDVEIAIYMESWNFALRSEGLAQEIAASIEELLPSEWMGFEISATFVGNKIKHRLRTVETRLLHRIVRSRGLGRWLLLPPLGTMLLTVLGLTAINNWRLRNDTGDSLNCCSSILVRLRRGKDPIQ